MYCRIWYPKFRYFWLQLMSKCTAGFGILLPRGECSNNGMGLGGSLSASRRASSSRGCGARGATPPKEIQRHLQAMLNILHPGHTLQMVSLWFSLLIVFYTSIPPPKNTIAISVALLMSLKTESWYIHLLVTYFSYLFVILLFAISSLVCFDSS